VFEHVAQHRVELRATTARRRAARAGAAICSKLLAVVRAASNAMSSSDLMKRASASARFCRFCFTCCWTISDTRPLTYP
jgi:hypothetical protein